MPKLSMPLRSLWVARLCAAATMAADAGPPAKPLTLLDLATKPRISCGAYMHPSAQRTRAAV